jgi:hypothetical protein
MLTEINTKAQYLAPAEPDTRVAARGRKGESPERGPKVAQIPTPAAGTGICGRCSTRWGGLNTAHCSVCHLTFTTQRASDRHRAGSHALDERRCLDPSTVGLVDAGRAYPCWGFPGREVAEVEVDDPCAERTP